MNVQGAREVAADLGGNEYEMDVTSPYSVRHAVECVERDVGPVSILVNNAGTDWFGFFKDTDEDLWARVIDINLMGVLRATHAVLPGMIERGAGRIVNVASGAAYLPMSSMDTAYAASKAALHRFSELLAGELTPHGVSVFSISPGLVRTAMTEDVFPDDAPWTPLELAPRLVRVLASGRADALAGRYLHAEHDDIEELIRRADEVVEGDLNAIRLRR